MPKDITLIPKGYRAGGGERFSFPKLRGTVLASFVLLVLIVVLWLGFLAATWVTRGATGDLERQIRAVSDRRDFAFEKEALALSRNIEAEKEILTNHKYWSVMLDGLASATHSQVVFHKLSVESNEDESLRLIIESRAAGLEQIAESLSLWQNMKQFRSLAISNLKLSNEGGFDFTVDMVLNKEALNKK